MTTRERPSDVGAADARRIGGAAGQEIRDARRSAGVAQRVLAERAGVSRTQLGRLERGELKDPSLALVCQVARAAGFSASLKLYPDGARLRDVGQLRVLDRFDRVVAPPLRITREVQLPIAADLRAWDERLTDGRNTASVECEVHLRDIQAVERRIAIKQRDDPRAGVVILLLADTAHNRRVLAEHREALRAQFPLDGGAIVRAVRAGRIPNAGGIVLI
jgi:transcriptional regulator with XRE-family HTH domain